VYPPVHATAPEPGAVFGVSDLASSAVTDAADELWELYVGAVIDLEVDGRAVCICGPGAGDLPAAAPVFVLTAYNPGGVERAEALNVEAEGRLEAEIASGGVTWWPAVGRSPDASWSEPGVAVAGWDRRDACRVGAAYGQVGVFELTGGQVRVVRCADEAVMRTAARII
jgi:hypothetical protein